MNHKEVKKELDTILKQYNDGLTTIDEYAKSITELLYKVLGIIKLD